MPSCPNCQCDNSEFNTECQQCGAPLPTEVFLQSQQSTIDQPHTKTDHRLPHHEKLGQFRDIQEIGRGGMGIVHKAFDERLQRNVALKFIKKAGKDRADQEERLLQEARMFSKLSHRNLVTLYDVHTFEDRVAIAMEWIEGHTLAEVEKPLSMPTLLNYAQGLVNGLKAAHDKNHVHGDLKAANVMVDDEDTIKILDFGLAHHVDSQAKIDHVTGIRGTPTAMAPEQFEGHPASKETDIFSLGILLYQLSTDQLPWLARDIASYRTKLHNAEPLAPNKHNPKLAKPFSDLILKCLHKDPRQRPTITELRDEIKSLRNQHITRIPRRMSLVAVIAMLALVGGSLWFGQNEQRRITAKSLAVLPLTNLTGDSALDVLCDGTMAQVGSLLARQASKQGYWVLPVVQLYGQATPQPQHLKKDYGIDAFISGSIRYHGDGYRLTLRYMNLENPQDSQELNFDLEAGDLAREAGIIYQKSLSLLDWPADVEQNQALGDDSGLWAKYLRARGYLYRNDRPGNLKRAIESLEHVLTAKPQFVEARLTLAEAYRVDWFKNKNQAALQRAIQQVEKALASQQGEARLHTTHGDLLIEQGKHQQAITAFKTALEFDAKNALAFYGLGRVYTQRQDMDNAEAAYQQASELAPYNWIGQTEFGRFYFLQGRFSDAVRIFERLAELAPQNAFARSNLGINLYYAGQPRRAFTEVGKALQLEPNAQLYSVRGTIAFYLKDYDTAITSFQAAIALQDTNYMFHGNLGDALRLAGQESASHEAYREAIKRVRAELKVNPDQQEKRSDLILYLAKSAQPDQARQELKQLPEQGGPLLVYLQALAYAILGEPEMAFEKLEQSLAAGYPFFEIDAEPEWEPYRNDPRYIKLSETYQKPS